MEELPPPLELECLNVLWRLGPSSVKQVREALLPTRPLAYTTVMTVLDRLVKRGAAERQQHGRSFRYEAQVGRQELQRLAVGQLIDRLFDGSAVMLRAFLSADAGSAGSASLATARPAPHPGTGENLNSAREPRPDLRPLDAELL
jgi:predicted transcriptional regulator